MTVDPAVVRERVEQVTQRLRGAAPSGDDVELVAVTKGFGSDAIAAVASAGVARIGENYAQELILKLATIRDERASASLGGATGGGAPRVLCHFIGRLQSNKVRHLAEAVDVWESVDRPSLLDELARRAPGATLLIQVNATGETNKGGCRPEDAAALVAHGASLDLNVNGMMTVGPTSGDPSATAAAFALVRRLVDDCGLATCSMGMSHDLDIALAEGTSRVRIGTALFGPRPAAG